MTVATLTHETVTLPEGVALTTEETRRHELYDAVAKYLGDDWTGSIEFRVLRGRVEGHDERRRYGTTRITEEGAHA